MGQGYQCYAVVDGFEITGGNAGDANGGGFLMVSGGVVQNCFIRDNTARNGGGVYFDRGGIVRNSIVVGNSAGTGRALGGGLYFYHGGMLQNSTVVSNTAPAGGGAAFVGAGVVENTIVYFNMAGMTVSNWSDVSSVAMFTGCCTAPDPGGCIADPPLLTGNEFLLIPGSPCIDGGVDAGAVALDIDGVARPLDGDDDGVAKWDIGAHEFVHPLADTDHDGMLDGDEVLSGTSPTNESQSLRFTSLQQTESDFMCVWSTVSGKYYTHFTSTILSGLWTNVTDPNCADIISRGDELSYTNATYGGGPRYFRVRVTAEQAGQ